MQPKMPDGWSISYNPKPIPNRRHDFDFYHLNYDGENGLFGTAKDIHDAIEQIVDIEYEMGAIDCKNGRPHFDGRGANYTAGYAAQYESEQQSKGFN